MSTRAEAVRAQDSVGATPSIDSALLDVLPQHVDATDGATHSLAFDVDFGLGAALADAGIVPAHALAAALAMVDSWLSGSDEVLVTLASAGAWRQSRMAPGAITASDIVSALDAATVEDARPCVWAVANESSVPAADFAASQWQLDGACLRVVLRAPLTREAVVLLGDAVVRALDAIAASPAAAARVHRCPCARRSRAPARHLGRRAAGTHVA